jgi:ABC-type phosphate/phosphonate transport system substrate-binding protein
MMARVISFLLLILFVGVGQFTALASESSEISGADARSTILAGMPVVFFESSINFNEASKGLDMWIDEMCLLDENSPNIELVYFENRNELYSQVLKNQVGLLFLPSTYYARLKDHIRLQPLGMCAEPDGHGVRFLLLVNKKSGWKNVSDLQGKNLTVISNIGFDITGKEWLRDVLERNNLPKIYEYFSHVEREPKASKAIVRLFFNQIDACLVNERSFKIAAELNPQLKTQLVPVAMSEPLMNVVMCCTDSVSDKDAQYIREKALKLQEMPKGKQILKLFRLLKVSDYSEDAMISVFELVKHHKNQAPF